MTVRSELLEFLNAMQNEVQMFDVDDENSDFAGMPELVDKIRTTIVVIERIFPMIQAIDEILLGEISPKLFHHKWKQVHAHLDLADLDIEISDDVTNFLGGFAVDIDEEDEGDDD